MPFPNYDNKHDEAAVINPDRYLEYVRERGRYPDHPAPTGGAILCYQAKLLDHVLANHETTPAGKHWASGMHLLNETGNQVGVMGRFGIGAPVAAAVLDELIAWGVTRFVSVGTAGSLQPDICIGDLVVCESAIRDEGTSHHYLPPGCDARPSPVLTNALAASLDELGLSYTRAAAWTTDAPYRETIAEVRRYQAEGVACVEMEAAALFAVGAHRNVDVAALFTISDSLADLTWRPEFHSDRTRTGLENLYRVALQALTRDPAGS